MSRNTHDARRWPAPAKPVADKDKGIYEDVELMDQSFHKNDLVELVINVTGKKPEPKQEKAVFGAGCFWHVEDAFRHIPGVLSTQVGFMGGTKENPTYKEVCTGETGHTEVTEVTFDPDKITYDHLLDIFWNIHDPTQVNRQGPDIGVQYRSVIFYLTDEQRKAAAASKERAQQSMKKPIATSIEPAGRFYRAEEYHQQYFEKTGRKACGF